MAYTFFEDRFMNPYEDEETRRKREEEERKRMGETEVGKTEVTQYADGSQTRTTTQELPPQGQIMRPVMRPSMQGQVMNVPGPVSPDNFERIRQIESGGRDFTPQGQPLTSSKGAMFSAQVMPSTAQQPGFGIRPAQSQTPEEYNRVGREYFQAMRNRYNDDIIAAAAYNAGPGRVDQALRQAQQTGQDFRTFLPQETQQYIQRFNQQRPIAQVQQPQPQPQRGILGLLGPSVGASAEGTEGEQVAQQRMMDYTNRFQQNQDNVTNLVALKDDQTAPLSVRNLASERAYELMSTELNKRKAQEESQKIIASGDTKKMADILASDPKDQEGSWLKLAFLGFVSPQAAALEAAKLGLVPTKYSQSTITNEDGTTTTVQLKTRADGKVIGGIDLQGNPLSQDMLNKAMAGVGQKLGIVGGTYVNDKTGEVGRVVTDEKTGQSFVQTDKGRKPMTGFRPQSSTGTLADQRTRLVQEMNLKLQGKTAEEQMAIQRNYNQQLVAAGYAPLQPSDTPLIAPQIAGGPQVPQQVAGPIVPGVMPQAAQPTVAPAGTAVAPGQTPAAMAPRPTGPQLAAQAEGLKKEATEVAEDVAKAKINVGKNSDTADYLLTKINELITHPGFSVSVGATVQPGFQFIPGTDRANWSARFEEIKGQQFLQAFESLKGGGAITDKEGAKAQAAISRMNTGQSEKEFKEAAEDFIGVVQRGVDRQRKKAGLEPLYGTEAASKKLSLEDKRALEWAKNNPNDPRAEQVRKRLGQ